MTIRHPASWLFLLCIVALGLGTISYIFDSQFHSSPALRDVLILLDTDTTSINV